MRNRISKDVLENIIANYASVGLIGAISLITVPIYLKWLGPVQWGVVAICTSAQNILWLLDAGLSQIMPRDIARVHGNVVQEWQIYRAYQKIYLYLGGFCFIILFFFPELIIHYWLARVPGAIPDMVIVIRLIAAQFFFQLVNAANTGYWNGVQRQRKANTRQIVFFSSRHILALCAIYIFGSKAILYVLPFTMVALVEVLMNSLDIKKTIKVKTLGPARKEDVLSICKQAAGLALGIVIGMLVSQFDRIVLARKVGVVEYGQYVIVANLGLAFMQLQYPIIRALFPKLVTADQKKASYRETEGMVFLLLFIFCILPCILCAVFARQILMTWIGDEGFVKNTVFLFRFILLSVAVNACYHLLYIRLVSSSNVRAIVGINFLSLLFSLGLAFYFWDNMSINFGGYLWLSISLAQLIMGWGVSDREKRKVRSHE